MSGGDAREARVVFVNRFFHPDHSATSQILSELAFALAASGRCIAVVASRQLYDAPDATLPASETIDGVDVHRIATTRFGRFNLPGRAVDFVTFYLSAIAALLRLLRRGDILVIKTDPPLMSVVLTPFARLRGARVVNWLQDVYPEVAEADGLITNAPARLAARLVKALRDRSLRRADANVVLGERMAALVRAAGVEPGRVDISPNWALETIFPRDDALSDRLRAERGFAGKFIVGYSGNLGRVHDSETMLGAIRLLAQDGNVAWLFIGGGAKLAQVKETVAREQRASVSFLPYQDKAAMSDSLALAHVHVVTLRPAFEGLVVPSKSYGIFAAGRPTIFIGAPDGEVAGLLEKFSCGLSVPEGDPAALADAIRTIAANPDLCRRMGANARAAFEANFTLDHAVARWQALLGRLPTA